MVRAKGRPVHASKHRRPRRRRRLLSVFALATNHPSLVPSCAWGWLPGRANIAGGQPAAAAVRRLVGNVGQGSRGAVYFWAPMRLPNSVRSRRPTCPLRTRPAATCEQLLHTNNSNNNNDDDDDDNKLRIVVVVLFDDADGRGARFRSGRRVRPEFLSRFGLARALLGRAPSPCSHTRTHNKRARFSFA
jgi:hypothetical protein